MRKILVVLMLVSVFALPSLAEAGKTKRLLKKMTKPTMKEKMEKLLHPCPCKPK